MSPTTRRSVILMVLMIASALAASMLRANSSLASQRPPIDLERQVPREFGEWKEAPGFSAQLVNPEQQATINRIYSETLARTYVNRSGYRVMLSIAYGKDQSDALQLHKPEVCYPAQGFRLLEKSRVQLQLSDRTIDGTQLLTQLGQRIEPITYWIVIGDYVTLGGLHKKLTEMRYSLLDGVTPDGLLIRISSLDRETKKAYQLQNEFASELVNAIHQDARKRFAGVDAQRPH